MKTWKLILGVALASALAASCKPDPELSQKGELKSFAFLQADNEGLTADYAAEAIEEMMIVRVPEVAPELVATVTAAEGDEVLVNGEPLADDGKVTVDTSKPIDIVVTHTASQLATAYTVKVGKILLTKYNLIGEIEEPSMGLSYILKVNPKTNEPYIAYICTPTDKKKNVFVAKWTGSAFETVGGPIAPADETSVAVSSLEAFDFDPAGNPIILHKAGDVANLLSCRKFVNGKWELVGKAGFSDKFSTSYGSPEFYYVNGNPAFFVQGNAAKTDPDYKNITSYAFNGSEWVKTTGSTALPNHPTYDAAAGNAGLFYRGATACANGKWYIITSCNLHGYNLYEVAADGTKTQVVSEFKPEGEDYGIPTALHMVAGANGKLYVLAGSSKASKYIIYSYDEAAKTLKPYSAEFVGTAGSLGSISEYLTFEIDANGKFWAAMAKTQDDPTFIGGLDENRRWEDWMPTDAHTNYHGDAQIAIAPNGEKYLAFVYRDTASDPKNNVVCLLQYGLEADILPE